MSRGSFAASRAKPETSETERETVRHLTVFESGQIEFRLNEETVIAAQKEVTINGNSDKECWIPANKIEER